MVIQNLDNGINGINCSCVIVECVRRVSTREEGIVVLVTTALADVEGREGWAIAAAEFVFVGADREGELTSGGRRRGGGRGGGGGGVVVVVEHEVADGFAGEFAALGHEIEVEHELALGDAFTEKEISDTNQIPDLFGHYGEVIFHFWVCNFEGFWWIS